MIIIADSGSTKTDWVLTDGKKNISRYSTIGFNPYFTGTDLMYDSLNTKLATQFNSSQVKKVFFYGAGCSNEQNVTIANKALSKFFVNAKILVGHDMLAAARALLGNKPGFAAIIGTGSNTCIYDGKDVEKNIDSLGYLLGDEGSGSYIGRKIVKDYLRGYLPRSLEKKFTQYYSLKPNDIFDALYNKAMPNRFLASFCKFADHNKEHEYIRKILKESFNDFFANLVSRYPDYEQYSFNCVGSVGFIFKQQLKEVAEEYNMKMGKLIPSPIQELVNYHLGH